jgi:uncharacterized protein (TIGR03435 family)
MTLQPTRRTVLLLISSILFTAGAPAASAQAQEANTTQNDASKLPAFEVATIKPIDPDPDAKHTVGFYSRPGGRVFLGYATLKMMMSYAFDVQEYQISGGPAWVAKDRYDVDAVAPDSSASRTAAQPPIKATPSEEQRKMIQRLLIDRFGLKVHRETREGPVYILTRGKKSLELKQPKDKDADSRSGYMMKPGGVVWFGTNVTMPFLAHQLGSGSTLNLPVLDRTGIQGSYDFELPLSDPENHDPASGALQEMDALGLKLERAKGPIEVIVIDQVQRPSEN